MFVYIRKTLRMEVGVVLLDGDLYCGGQMTYGAIRKFHVDMIEGEGFPKNCR